MSKLGVGSKVAGFGQEFIKVRDLGHKAWKRRVSSPQGVQCQGASQKPPKGFEPLICLGRPLNVLGHVAPRGGQNQGLSYLTCLSLESPHWLDKSASSQG